MQRGVHNHNVGGKGNRSPSPHKSQSPQNVQSVNPENGQELTAPKTSLLADPSKNAAFNNVNLEAPSDVDEQIQSNTSNVPSTRDMETLDKSIIASRQRRRQRNIGKIPGPGILWIIPAFGLLVFVATVVVAVLVPASTQNASFAWSYVMPIFGGTVMIASICIGGALIRRKRLRWIKNKRQERENVKQKVRNEIVEEILEMQRGTAILGGDESGEEEEHNYKRRTMLQSMGGILSEYFTDGAVAEDTVPKIRVQSGDK